MTVGEPSWQVLLIVGSSGTGKTVLGRQLAEHWGISLVLVDDLRMVIQAVTTAEQVPPLHRFLAEWPASTHSTKAVFVGLLGLAQAMEPAIRMVMAHHLVVSGAGKIILEGDGILPRLADPDYLLEQSEFSGRPMVEQVKGVFLYKGDSAVILERMLARGRGFRDLPAGEQEALAEGSCLLGEYFVQQAKTHGVPLVPSRPFDTLLERVIQVIA